MSDVRRGRLTKYAGVFVDDPNGTHYLVPMAKWERIRSFECCKDAERAPRLEAKVLELKTEIEQLRKLLRELEESDA